MSAKPVVAAETPLLRTRGLGLRYADGTQALQPLDLELARGEFCVLLGPSGSGKSSLLRLLNGLAAPSVGSIELEGRRLAPRDLRWRGRRIASIHQAVDLVPRAGVLANVLSGSLAALPAWRGLLGLYSRALQRRACRLLAEVGLDEAHLYRRAGTLSGGQQQRVGIARAFMLEPALVLADEPVSSLDPASSRAVLELLRRAAREHGASVLCSLHQVDLAREFGDRILGLRDGALAFDLRDPAQLDAAALLPLYAQARARA
jgi:phosphonate transport system ATP-binding protein